MNVLFAVLLWAALGVTGTVCGYVGLPPFEIDFV